MGLKRNNRRPDQSSTPSVAGNSNRHSLPEDSARKSGTGFLNGVLLVVAAIGMTSMFFPKLWTGGGLIGGDTYTYYFPQKVAYQEALRAGRLPLWKSVVSLGYPQLAESQTGALYPLNVVLYSLLDVNTAYNASHLLHYMAAYVFTWLLARRFGVGATGSHLAALSFVYGWFPPRACLEWAIFGGAYFPLIIWCLESYLQSAKLRWLAVACVALGAFLTTGHFNLAYITLLLGALLVLLRLTWATNSLAAEFATSKWKAAVRCGVAAVLGFALAAPQLLPTIELKAVSQREEGAFNQAYGHIPVWYLTQPFWPTIWYAPDINPDETLFNSNRIEANLYFGVIPFYLALGGLFWRLRDDVPGDRRMAILGLAGAAGVVLATGFLMPLLRHVPGFGYFAGPGRYGMLTALAVGIAGGKTFDRLLSTRPLVVLWPIVALGALAVTAWDLSYVHNCVTYLTFLDRPPISLRDHSTIGKHLRSFSEPVRMLAPGPNLPSITGVNCVPEYLGIGPRQYYDKSLAIPRFSQEEETPELRDKLIRWLQKAGVTHVLTQQPLDEKAWPVGPVRVGQDPFLNAAWGRFGRDLFLYPLQGASPLAYLVNQPDGAGVTFKRREPESVVVEMNAAARDRLILLDLPYPGWRVFVDDNEVEAGVFEGQFRSVEVPAGKHVVEWRFLPRSFYSGVTIFGLALAGLVAWLALERRRAAGRKSRDVAGLSPSESLR
jgi:hypothetical protein